jgi:hypothetical protein
MKRWIWVLAFNTSRDDKPEVSFLHFFVDARDEAEAHAKGAEIANVAVPRAVASGFNDYVTEVAEGSGR